MTGRWLASLCDILSPSRKSKQRFWLLGGYGPTRRLALTPIMDKARPSYSGRLRKLVVALDIGTTFSGAAYALLDPGKVPQIRSVTRKVLPLTLIR